VNDSDNHGDTPLHEAARRGYILCVTALRGLGADSGARNHAGQTPLEAARAANKPDAALWLECLETADAGAIDPRRFAEFKNVEARREFVRLVGIERIVQALGAKTADRDGDYELLLVDLGGETGETPYLKMLNPSAGVWQLEAAPKEIKTVKEALAWRNQSELIPAQLT
jgi:hypothetical protein